MASEYEVIKIYSSDNPGQWNIPQPDPSWDYATAWEMLNQARSELDGLIKFLSSQEGGDKETSQEVYKGLRQTINTCLACCDLIAFTPPFEE